MKYIIFFYITLLTYAAINCNGLDSKSAKKKTDVAAKETRLHKLEDFEKNSKETLAMVTDFFENLKKEPVSPIKQTMMSLTNVGINISKDRLMNLQKTLEVEKS